MMEQGSVYVMIEVAYDDDNDDDGVYMLNYGGEEERRKDILMGVIEF